jgi:hypothetical protein
LLLLGQDGEPVEFTSGVDDRGRVRADRVTGPMGSFVQGVPRYRPSEQGGSGGGGGGGGGRRDRERTGGYRQDFDPVGEDMSWDRPWELPGENESFSAGHGAPPTADFHELDLPEDELDDNAAAEAEGASKKEAEAAKN